MSSKRKRKCAVPQNEPRKKRKKRKAPETPKKPPFPHSFLDSARAYWVKEEENANAHIHQDGCCDLVQPHTLSVDSTWVEIFRTGVSLGCSICGELSELIKDEISHFFRRRTRSPWSWPDVADSKERTPGDAMQPRLASIRRLGKTVVELYAFDIRDMCKMHIYVNGQF